MIGGPFFVDLQRGDGSTVSIMALDVYLAMRASEIANTVAVIFQRCACGSRVDVGTRAEIARAIEAIPASVDEFSRSKVSPR